MAFNGKGIVMKIGFIGCGNMGGALAKAAAKVVLPQDVIIAEKDEEKARAFALQTGVTVATMAEVASCCRYLFLAVKPQVLASVMEELAPLLKARSEDYTLISMAAGVKTDRLHELLGFKAPVIRIMPNLPVAVGEGMILYTATPEVSEEALDGFLTLMKEAGRMVRLEERLIDAGTSVSGCGPAFVCLFIEALADGGVQCGLTREQALLLAEQTLLGTAKTLLTTEGHPAALKDAVCSPGGSTIAGVHSLEASAFRGAVSEAVIASCERNKELGKS